MHGFDSQWKAMSFNKKSPRVKTLSLPILQLWWVAIRPLFLQFPNDLDNVQHCKTQAHVKNHYGIEDRFFSRRQKFRFVFLSRIIPDSKLISFNYYSVEGIRIWRCIFPNGRWRYGSFDANWPYNVSLDLYIRSNYHHYTIDRNLENVPRTIFLPSHHYNIGK